MSLSNPTTKNPATKFIEWSGSKGQFKYYDKTEETNVFFETSIYIIPLDDLSCIKGYDDQNNCGYYSNEVKFLDKQKLYVKSFKGGVVADGIYKDLKLPSGCRFTKSIYAAMITGNKENVELELVNFQLNGSAIGSWIDAKVKVDSGEVIILKPSTVELKKGTTIYFAPQIIRSEKREDILQRCIDMDKELQKYLDAYLNVDHREERTEDNVVSNQEKKDIDNFNDIDDLPF
jgi:hypothetical protein